MHRHQVTTKAGHLTINHLLIIIMAVFIGIQVYMSNRIATSGQLLSELEQKAVALEDENRKLLSQNVDYMSLHELSEQAQILGYVEPETVLNLGDGTSALASR